MSFLQYQRKAGDAIRARDWNAVLAELDRRLGLAAPSGRGRRRRRASSGGDIAFEVKLTQADNLWEARFERGLIAGVEPTIEGKKISEIDSQTGQSPALIIHPSRDIDERTGTGYLFARLSLRADFSLDFIEPVCLAARPDAAARQWKAYKLLALLSRTPADDPDAELIPWQAVEHNLAWFPTQRRANGAARHLFWATS